MEQLFFATVGHWQWSSELCGTNCIKMLYICLSMCLTLGLVNVMPHAREDNQLQLYMHNAPCANMSYIKKITWNIIARRPENARRSTIAYSPFYIIEFNASTLIFFSIKLIVVSCIFTGKYVENLYRFSNTCRGF